MREKLIVNDLHLGVQRVGGTTIASAQALRQYLLSSLRKLLLEHTDKDIIINGDLFDTFQVPLSDVLGFHAVVADWMRASVEPGIIKTDPVLVLGRGNHDISKDSSKMSSFDFIGQILSAQFPRRVKVVTQPELIFPGIYMIPHVQNQDMFDLEMKRAEALRDTLILVHANYDNYFATQSDNALNVPADWCNMMLSYNNYVIFGHEHIGREVSGALVTGNQFPSSVSDCLDNLNKYAHILTHEQNKKPEREAVRPA